MFLKLSVKIFVKVLSKEFVFGFCIDSFLVLVKILLSFEFVMFTFMIVSGDEFVF